MERQIVRPMPEPCGLVVKKALKNQVRLSGWQSHTGVADGDEQLTILAQFRLNRKFTDSVLHRLDAIAHRFINTCCSCTRSAVTLGSSVARSVRMQIE
jgi:hypothetical protein